MALTAKRIARAKPGKRKSDGEPVGRRYGDGNGLYLQVNKDGVKSWLLRYERDGRERFMGLGPLHTINLDEARERARKARLSLLDGIDPLEARDRARRPGSGGGHNHHFRRSRPRLLQLSRTKMEEREAPCSVSFDAGNLRIPEDWDAAGRRD